MDQFIELHQNGEKRLINLRWVEEIREDKDYCVTIYFAFANPNSVNQDYLNIDESYDEVKRLIWRQTYNEDRLYCRT